ncbi:MAG: hypothetical protein DHS20C13_12720 [Thermodesulfobacteriota bacterium]|nr:MAG: hypothetical protein DHS20C13_12720 [Thermodesulfobacteriota bacterium]
MDKPKKSPTKKTSKEALKEIELRQSLILKSVPMAVYAVNVNGESGAIYISENIKIVTGFEANRFMADKEFWQSRIHSEDREKVLNAVNLSSSKTNFEIEYRWKCSDGKYHWFLDRAVLIKERSGKPVEIVGTWLDITDRKNAEDSLKKSNKKLSKKNRYEEIINSVTRSVHKSIKLQQVLDNAVSSLSTNVECADAIEIYILEKQFAVLKAHSGIPNNYYRQVKILANSENHTWMVLNFGELLYIKDSDVDTRLNSATKKIGIMSSLSMPISAKDRTIGCINIYSKEKDAFNTDETNLLEIITRQIEVAINNAKQASELENALSEVNKLKKQLESENIYLKEEIKTEHNFEEIIGATKSLKDVLDKVQMVAKTDATVLIRGETGTGKELIARSIHSVSKKSGRPLVKVNCPAIPSGLIESELFGHEKGAFTGALTKKIGKFELADGGTIMLDELGDLPLESQAKLLRVLQEKEFERVGGTKTIKVNVRVIAATNRDLEEAVNEGKFRADLFYRMNVFPIDVPPLRERKEDIDLIAHHFMNKFSTKLGKNLNKIGPETIKKLKNYAWPGNIRELENIIERASILSTGNVLHISEDLYDSSKKVDIYNNTSPKLEDIEKDHIIKILNSTSWQIHGESGAAKVLGMNPSTLRTRMAKLGIKKKTVPLI